MQRQLLLLCLILFLSCQNQHKNDADQIRNDSLQVDKPLTTVSLENLDLFLDNFAKDSLFRVSRTKFPLAGYNSDENDIDSVDSLFTWSRSEFLFYSNLDFNNKKEPDLIKRDIMTRDKKVKYRLYKENSGYDVSYHFEYIMGKWYLTYYSYRNL